SGKTGALLRSFLAFAGFDGGVNVASGDVNNDGSADVIVGAATTSSHVKVFSGKTGAEIRSFLAFAGVDGGIRVGAGRGNGDGIDDILVAVASGVQTHVKSFDGATLAVLDSFFALAGLPGGAFVAGST